MPKVGADHSTHTQSMPTNPCSSKIAYLIKFCRRTRTTPRSMKRIISTFHNVALPAGWQSHFHHSDASLVRSIETPNWAISMSLKAKENRLDNFSAGSIFVVDFSMFQRAPIWQLSRWNCVITKRKLTPPAPKSMRAICRWHERKFAVEILELKFSFYRFFESLVACKWLAVKAETTEEMWVSEGNCCKQKSSFMDCCLHDFLMERFDRASFCLIKVLKSEWVDVEENFNEIRTAAWSFLFHLGMVCWWCTWID